MSKGSWRRPAQVDDKQVADNWKRIYGDKKEQQEHKDEGCKNCENCNCEKLPKA